MNILDEIKKHNLDAFKRLDAGHEGVSMALKYFDSSGNQKMALRLRQIIENGNIRLGPFEGFAAAAVVLPQGDFILLSDLNQKNSTVVEIMASLVREAGSFKDFNCSKEENDMRSLVAVFWMKQHSSQPTVPKTQDDHKEVPRETPKETPKGAPKGSLIDVLLEDQMITQEQLNDARDKQKGSKKPLQDLLVEMGFISDKQIAEVYSKMFGMPLYRIKGAEIDQRLRN